MAVLTNCFWHKSYVKWTLSFISVAILILVVYSTAVYTIYGEVGAPEDGKTTDDWIIEDGDDILREHEKIEIDGNIIIKPGGNLTLFEVELVFDHPDSGSYKLEVQKDTTEDSNKAGELYVYNSVISVIDPEDLGYYNFFIFGNMTMHNSKVRYVGSSDPIDTYKSGIQIYSDDVLISNSLIESCEESGIYCEADPHIYNNTIQDNVYGIYYKDAVEKISDCESNKGENKFGLTISAVSDLNGDDYDDIVVGAPYNDDNGIDAGAVYIFYGSQDFELSDINLFNADLIYLGENAYDNFGSSISTAGDLNKDGLNELLIGSSGEEKVYIYFSSVDGLGGYLKNTTSQDFESGTLEDVETSNDDLYLSGTYNEWKQKSKYEFEEGKHSNLQISGHVRIGYKESSVDVNTVAFWRFSDGTGQDVEDETTYNDGTLGDDSSEEDEDPQWDTGYFEEGLYFDGVDDYVKVSDSDSLDIENELTIECWIKIITLSDEIFFLKTNAYRLEIVENNNKYYFVGAIKKGSWKEFDDFSKATDLSYFEGGWIHLAFVYDGKDMITYINGMEDNRKSISTTISTTSGDLYIGGNGGSDCIKSIMDEVKISNIARDNFNVKNVIGKYNEYSIDWDTVGLYHLNEQSGPAINDETIYDNTGTIVGSILREDGYFENGIELDGSNYLNLNDNYDLDDGTIEMWFSLSEKFDSNSNNNMMMFFKKYNSQNRIELFLDKDNNGKMHFLIQHDGSVSEIFSDITSWDQSVWYHVGVTWGSEEMKMYINGEIQSDTDSNTDNWVNGVSDTNNVYIGVKYDTSGSNYFEGIIDEIRISEIALTEFKVNNYFKVDNENPISENIEGLWHLNEGDGTTTYDQSGNENDGSLDQCTWIENGKFGSALYFDGADSYVDISDSDSLDLTQKISVEAWVNLEDQINTNNLIVCKDEAYKLLIVEVSNHYYLTGYVYIDAGPPSGGWKGITDFTGARDLSVLTDEWHHLAFTYDSSNQILKTYIDGIVDSTKSVSGSIRSNTNSLSIGCLNSGSSTSDHIKGKIDEVVISNIAKNHFDVEYPSDQYTNLLLHMDENTGLKTKDSTEYINDGTIYDGDEYGGTWANGYYGKGLEFDGTNDYILIKDSDSLDLTESITLDAMVKFDTLSNQAYTIFSKDEDYILKIVEEQIQGQNSEYHLSASIYIDVDTGLNWYGITDFSNTYTSAVDLVQFTGLWIHVAMTYDGEYLITYIDGKIDSKLKLTGALEYSDKDLFVGKTDGTGDYFDGVIDEARISSVCRSNYIVYTGTFESQVHSLTKPTFFDNITWDSDWSDPGTSIKLQVRSSATLEALATASWFGPTTTCDYYINSNTDLNPVHNGDEYIQFKAILESFELYDTPSLDNIVINYHNHKNLGTYTSKISTLTSTIKKVIPDWNADLNGQTMNVYVSKDGVDWGEPVVKGNSYDLTTTQLQFQIKMQSNGYKTPILHDIKIYYTFLNDPATAALSGGSESFGEYISSSGDINNDGYDDVVVGNPNVEIPEIESVDIYWGGASMNNNVDKTITKSGNQFGKSVLIAGDIDSDFYDDLIVGEPGGNKAYLYYGNSIVDGVTIADITISGDASGGGAFGTSISSIENLDNDNYPEILIGDPTANKVYLYLGSTIISCVDGTLDSTDANVIISGDDTNGGDLGEIVANAGDVNTDGYSDFILGDSSYTINTESNTGSVYFFYGSEKLASSSSLTAENDADYKYYGEKGNTNFGYFLSSGDLNNDSYNDFIIGAPNYDSIDSTNCGKIYVFSVLGQVTMSNYIYNNDYGIYLDNSNMGIFNNQIYENNDCGIYSEDSSIVVDHCQINTEISDYELSKSDGIYLEDSVAILRSNMIYTLDGNGIVADDSSPFIHANTITSSSSEFVDSFMDDSNINTKNLVDINTKSGTIQLAEHVYITAEHWEDPLFPEWTINTQGQASQKVERIEDHWENSGYDLNIEAISTASPEASNGEVDMYREVKLGLQKEGEDFVSSDFHLDTHFNGEIAEGITLEEGNTISSVSIVLYDDDQGVPGNVIKSVKYSTQFYGFDHTDGWTSIGSFWYKLFENNKAIKYVTTSNSFEVMIDKDIDDYFESIFGYIDWNDVEYIKILYSCFEESDDPDADPVIISDHVNIYVKEGASQEPEYFQNGFIISEEISVPTNNDWDMLYISKDDPNPSFKLKISVLDPTSGQPISGYADRTDKEIDLSNLNSPPMQSQQSSIKLKAYFDSGTNKDFTSILRGWRITFICTNDISIKSLNYADPVIRDCSISSGNNIDMDISSNSDPILINTTYDEDKLNIDSTSSLTVKWYLGVKLIAETFVTQGDTIGQIKIESPISDLNVKINDNTDSEIFNGYTDVSGWVENIQSTELVLTSNSRTYYTPHKISVFDPLTESQMNNIEILTMANKNLTLIYGKDSDGDAIIDSIENNANVYWFEAEDHVKNPIQKRHDWESSFEFAAVKGSSDNYIINKIFPLPDNIVSTDYKLFFRAKKLNPDDLNVNLQIDILDGGNSLTSFPVTYELTNDYRFYSTPIFTTTTSNGYVTIKITDQYNDPSIILDRIAIGKNSEIVPGQLSDPIDYDIDFDWIADGYEIRSKTFWYEAEYYPNTGPTQIEDDPDASNSKTLEPDTASETIKIPMDLESSTEAIFSSKIDNPGLPLLLVTTYGPEIMALGRSFNYVISLENTDVLNDIIDTTIVSDLPAEVEFNDASEGGEYDPINHEVSWDFTSISPQEVNVVWINVVILSDTWEGQKIFNDITITYEYLSNQYNEDYSIETIATKSWASSFVLEKKGPTFSEVSRKFSYIIIIENMLDVNAEYVELTDILPTEVNYVSSDPAGSYSSTPHEIVWWSGASQTIYASELIIITVQVEVKSGTPAQTVYDNKVEAEYLDGKEFKYYVRAKIDDPLPDPSIYDNFDEPETTPNPDLWYDDDNNNNDYGGSYIDTSNGKLIQWLDIPAQGNELTELLHTEEIIGETQLHNKYHSWEFEYKIDTIDGNELGYGVGLYFAITDGANFDKRVTYEIGIGVLEPKDDVIQNNEDDTFINKMKILCDGETAEFFRRIAEPTMPTEYVYSSRKVADISDFQDTRLTIGVWGYPSQTEGAEIQVKIDNVKVTLNAMEMQVKKGLTVKASKIVPVDTKYEWYKMDFDIQNDPSGNYNFELHAKKYSSLTGNILYVDKIVLAKTNQIYKNYLEDASTSKDLDESDFINGEYETAITVPPNSIVTAFTMKLQGESTDSIEVSPRGGGLPPIEQQHSDIYGDIIVWEEKDSSGKFDIFMFDLSNPTQGAKEVCPNDEDQRYPAIFGDYIVWQDNRRDQNDWDICIYDISIGDPENSDPYFIPHSQNRLEYNQEKPSIYKDLIVWQEDSGVNGKYDIYMYDLDVDDNGVDNFNEPTLYGIDEESNDDNDRDIATGDRINEEILNYMNDDNDYWADDNSGNPNNYDLGVDEIFLDNDNNGEYSDGDECIYKGPNDEIDTLPGAKIYPLIDEDYADPGEIKIFSNNKDKTEPKIFENKIVYIEDPGAPPDIGDVKLITFHYDGDYSQNTLGLTMNNNPVNNPPLTIESQDSQWSVDIYGDTIVYATGSKAIIAQQGDPLSIPTTEIVIYDIPSQTKSRIGAEPTHIDIYKNIIVYDQFFSTTPNTYSNIYMYDLSFEEGGLLTNIQDYVRNPAIFADTIVWEQGIGSYSDMDIHYFNQRYYLDIGDDGSVEWECNKLTTEPENTKNLYSEINEYIKANEGDRSNGDVRVPIVIKTNKDYTDGDFDFSISNINLHMDCLIDPMDFDTDGDALSDGDEFVRFGGWDILEAEDTIDFLEWLNPQVTLNSDFDTQQDTKINENGNFIHQTGVTLTTSNNYAYDEGITNSWIRLTTTPDKTGIYKFIINPDFSDLDDYNAPRKINGPYLRWADGEYRSVKKFSGKNYIITNDIADYLHRIINEAIYVDVKDYANFISPIQYTEYPQIANVEMSTSPKDVVVDKTSLTAHWSYIGEYSLIQDTEYTITIGMDWKKIQSLASNPPSGISAPNFVRLIDLDNIRIERRGIDPLARDSDKDGLDDGEEMFDFNRYPLNPDADGDGINDYDELNYYHTNLGYRDSDFDGIRDGVEVGLTSTNIFVNNGEISSPGSWMERLAHWGDPFNYQPINNFDADNGQTTTDPNDRDTDDDGLGDGWTDGWTYDPSPFEDVTAKTYDQNDNRYRDFNYWRYNKKYWKNNGEVDNIIQIYEGEDLDLDGERDNPQGSEWIFDENNFEAIGNSQFGFTETDPTEDNMDTDGDGIPDGYEVWYSHIEPFEMNDKYILDPTKSTDAFYDKEVVKDPSTLICDYSTGSYTEEIGDTYEAIAQKIIPDGQPEDVSKITKIMVNLKDFQGLARMEIWSGIFMEQIGGSDTYRPAECVGAYNVYVEEDDEWYPVDIEDNIFNSIYGTHFFLVMKCVDSNFKWYKTLYGGSIGDVYYQQSNGMWIRDVSSIPKFNYKAYQDGLTLGIGDGLTNLDEYIIGTNPKDHDMDREMIGTKEISDGLIDGVEIYGLKGNVTTNTPGGTIFRTTIIDGAVVFDNYKDGSSANDYIEYDGDGRGNSLTNSLSAYKYTFDQNNPNKNPDSTFIGSSPKNHLIHTLDDGAKIYLSHDSDHNYIFVWNPGVTLGEYEVGVDGNMWQAGTCYVFNRGSNPITNMIYTPSCPGKELYLSCPFDIDTDLDGIKDGFEIKWYEDSEGSSGDWRVNVRDPDSDNDGLDDRKEIAWMFDSDGDGYENMIDPDSDDDGLKDGNEVDYAFDTDGDGEEIEEDYYIYTGDDSSIVTIYFNLNTIGKNPPYTYNNKRNMIDKDSDGDGLADGWIDDYIWDWNANSGDGGFVKFSDYSSSSGYGTTNYAYPTENDGLFDPWEGEDLNADGKIQKDEPSPVKVDTDGDGLWDGFDIYENPSTITTRKGTTSAPVYPKRYGELYYFNYDPNTNKGMPFSGGDGWQDNDDDGWPDIDDEDKYGLDGYRPHQNTIPLATNVQKSDQVNKDTDNDGLIDYLELMGWIVNVEDWCIWDWTSPDPQPTPSIPSEADWSSRKNANPNEWDTDDDSLNDFTEWCFTDPTVQDTDRDGLKDNVEDSNGNGVWDNKETSPIDRDTDDDYLCDGWNDGGGSSGLLDNIKNDGEYGEDFDGDGSNEGTLNIVSEPNPLKRDSDKDGIIDGIEYGYLKNLNKVPETQQSDNDGTVDLQDRDSDADGLNDGEENINLDDELNTDGSGNKLESDPTNPDCDGDDLLDGAEPSWRQDTDQDDEINVWDIDSNCDPDSSNYDEHDYSEVYVVFRTDAPDVDADGTLDYEFSTWIAVDNNGYADLEDPDNTYNLDVYTINKIVKNPSPTPSIKIEIEYPHPFVPGQGEEPGPDIIDVMTPEGYEVYVSDLDSGIYEFAYVKISPDTYVKYQWVTQTNYDQSHYDDIHSRPKTTPSSPNYVENNQETYDARVALNLDYDFDGIQNTIELSIGSDPWDRDSDDDGVFDGDESIEGTNPSIIDPDSDDDGLSDGTELGITEPITSDGKIKGTDTTATYPSSSKKTFVPDEDPSTQTDPMDSDTDDDGLSDGDDEDNNFNGKVDSGEADPRDKDTDDDGVIDGDEDDWDTDSDLDGDINVLDHDSDGDGIFDGTEKGITNSMITDDTDPENNHFIPDANPDLTTYPTNPDSDGDNIKDGIEDRDKNGAIDGDANFNGVMDEDENWFETSPYPTSGIDSDQDTLNDGNEDLDWDGEVELENGETNPLLTDSDCDGLTDGVEDKTGTYGSETSTGTDPSKFDSDGDGLSDGVEVVGWSIGIYREATKVVEKEAYVENSDPNIVDTDGDLLSDYDEFMYGSDPRMDDTDEDGMDDYTETSDDDPSMPTGIEGTPPDLNDFKAEHKIVYHEILGIPTDLKITLSIDVTDNAGVDWVYFHVEGQRGGETDYMDGVTSGRASKDFKIDWGKSLLTGYDVDIIAVDQNGNQVNGSEEIDSVFETFIKEFLSVLEWVAQQVTKFISMAIDWIWDMITDMFETVTKPILDAIDNYINGIQTALDEAFHEYMTSDGEISEETFDNIGKAFFGPAWTAIKMILDILNSIQNIIQPFLDFIGDLINDVAEFVIDIIKSTFGGEDGDVDKTYIDYLINGDFIGLTYLLLDVEPPTHHSFPNPFTYIGIVVSFVSLFMVGYGHIKGLIELAKQTDSILLSILAIIFCLFSLALNGIAAIILSIGGCILAFFAFYKNMQESYPPPIKQISLAIVTIAVVVAICDVIWSIYYVDTDGNGIPDVDDTDIDGDGIPNDWEEEYGLDLMTKDREKDDKDGDGLSNYEEYLGWEIAVDKDGVNGVEETYWVETNGFQGSNPTEADSDGDGWDDSEERDHGTHPNKINTDFDDANDNEDIDPLKNILLEITFRDVDLPLAYDEYFVGKCDDCEITTVTNPNYDNDPTYTLDVSDIITTNTKEITITGWADPAVGSDFKLDIDSSDSEFHKFSYHMNGPMEGQVLTTKGALGDGDLNSKILEVTFSVGDNIN
jgi:beta propeller repeat protein